MRGTGAITVAAAAALLLAAAAPAPAALRIEAAAGVAALEGRATYRIGGAYTRPEGSGRVNDPLSEITFPLDVALATLALTAEAPLGRGALVVAGEFARSVSEGAGTIRDRDWTSAARPDLVTISSESDAALDAAIADVRVRWRFLEHHGGTAGGGRGAGGAWIAVGAGYLRERFSSTGSDVQQLSVYPELVGTRAGKVLDYEALYRIPYAEAAAGVGFGSPSGPSLALEARFAASPWARADDVDDHALRSKRSEGSCRGTALLGRVGAVLTAGRLSLAASVSRTALEASGTQTQERYADTAEGPAGLIGEIGQTIRSGQARYDLALGVRF